MKINQLGIKDPFTKVKTVKYTILHCLLIQKAAQRVWTFDILLNKQALAQ